MSLWSVLGNVGKTVGKVALGAAGGVLNTATGGLTGNLINANMFDKSPAATAAAPVAQIDGTQPQMAVQSNSSTGGGIGGFLDAATNFLTGRSHAQVDLHTTVGGTADMTTQGKGFFSSLPPWALYGGVGLAAFMLLKPRR